MWGAPVTNKSSYSFYDVAAQFHTLSEQLKTTTNAAERQDLLRQFRILLDQADSYVRKTIRWLNAWPRVKNPNAGKFAIQ